MKERRKLWRNFILWGIASFTALVTPLLTVLIINRERYFTTVQDAVKLTVGGLLCFFFLAVVIFGKARAPGGLFFCAFVFVLSCLLEPILVDLKLLSGMALVGACADWIFFSPRVRRCRELLHIDEQATTSAKATAAAMEDVLKQYVGRV